MITNRLTIRNKLLLVSVLSAFFISVVTLVITYYVSQISTMKEVRNDVNTLNQKILNLMQLEKNFSLTNNKRIKNSFDKLYFENQNFIKDLVIKLNKYDLPAKKVIEYNKKLNNYNKLFQKLYKIKKEVGFTRDVGDYGKLRRTVRKGKNLILPNNDTKLISYLQELRKLEMEFIITHFDKYSNKTLKQIDKIILRVNQSKTFSNQDIKSLNIIFKRYKKLFKKISFNIDQLGLFKDTGLYPKLNNSIEEAQKFLKHTVNSIDKSITTKIDKYNIEIWAISITFIILNLIVLYYISNKTIIKPIKDFELGLLNFFKYLNQEVETVQLLKVHSNDEIGQMAKHINENINKTKKLIDNDKMLLNSIMTVLAEFQEGDLSKRITDSSSNESLNTLTTLINKMANNLEKNIKSILSVLDEYKLYNYKNRISNDNVKAHFHELGNGINNLADSITKILIENRTNGVDLDNSSNTLLDSVENLKNNINISTKSIQQTSSQIDSVTNKINLSCNDVEEMASFSNELTTSVKEGEILAKKTTLAMDEINLQVSSINKAIEVIDQIAFQTNILSLNAAVESATAGEAGKGFAVVAGEVRNLANRSAQAAKEIKTLVENSKLKTVEGKSIADKMINGYSNLSTNINNTTILIDKVSKSYLEQQESLEDINYSISSSLDKTKSNADIVKNSFDVAKNTDKIAKEILKETEKTEFVGK